MLSALKIFFSQFLSPLIYILFLAAFISLLIGQLTDALVILAVVVFNAIFGTAWEYKASQAVAALKKFIAPKAKVIRNGHEKEILACDLVWGDTLILEAGDRVAADGELLEAYNLKIDEAPLTGEAVPVEKKVKEQVLTGTLVVLGRGLAKVTAVGEQTQFGQLAKKVKETPEVSSPLQKRLARFARYLAIGILGVAFFVFLVGFLAGHPFGVMFQTSIALAVSAIPEGLPVVVTVVLAVGMHRMAKRRTILKKLAAVESLGSTTLICADKTGTLTYGEMMVEKIYTAQGKQITVSGEGYKGEGEFFWEDGQKLKEEDFKSLSDLFLASLLCNDARVKKENGEWKIVGDPTEGALIVLTKKAGFEKEIVEKKYPRIAEFPFDPKLRYMATLHRRLNGRVIFVKGAPEKILAMADKNLDKEEILRVSHKMAKSALRVFAVGKFETKNPSFLKILEKNFEGKLQFLGLLGIADPPRQETEETLKLLKNAGVRVVMVTGDHDLTAQAIGLQTGLLDRGRLVSSDSLENLTDEELKKEIGDVSIFARATPEFKLRLIRAYQSLGEIVAMTGDGVNDAPALVSADIGVGMGKMGTEVAREASDMVIVDDNLSTIAAAVEEGRVIFENLRKVILYLLSTSAGEVLIILTSILLGLPLPLLAVQIIWLNLVTDPFSGVALAMEPREKEVMNQKPRSPKEFIISKIMIYRMVLVGFVMCFFTIWLYWWQLSLGKDLVEARTLALVTMAAFQWFNVFNCRSENKSFFQMNFFGNKFIPLALLICLILQILAVQTVFFQKILHTTSLSLGDWFLAIGVAATILIVEEIRKFLIKIWGK